jgi:hypothetical protein
MSLNWSTQAVENWEEVNTDENWPCIQNVIFYTMTVGMPRITAANNEEFLARLLKFNIACGASWQDLQALKKTYAELLPRLIGLATNASTKSITQFNKDLLGLIQSRMERI